MSTNLKTLNHAECLFKKRTTTLRIKRKVIFVNFTDNIDSYSYGDQTDNESNHWERFSDFVDLELISDSSNDDWMPKVVIITMIWMLSGTYKSK